MTSTLTEADRLAAIELRLEEVTRSLERVRELTADLSALSGEAFLAAAERLAEADRRGYFEFARATAGIVDRVITSYDEADVEALGENIVLILDTLKEMTQPDVMMMLRQTARTVRAEEPEELSLLGFLRQLRDPQVKRGLGRLVVLMRNLGGPTEGGN